MTTATSSRVRSAVTRALNSMLPSAEIDVVVYDNPEANDVRIDTRVVMGTEPWPILVTIGLDEDEFESDSFLAIVCKVHEVATRPCEVAA